MSQFLIAPLEALTDPALTDPERRVLLALYSFRNRHANTCTPSLPTLAERANVRDHTRVSKLTASLARKGWLTKRKRGFTGGNQYDLTIPERFANLDSDAKLAPEAKMESDTNSNLDSDAKSNLDSDAKCNKHSIKQKREHRGYSPQFDQFWSAYPNKKGKAEAARSFAKKVKDSQTLTLILRDIATRPDWKDPKFIPHPSTYLNGSRWEDEHETPAVTATPEYAI